jgi:hypothetical protein
MVIIKYTHCRVAKTHFPANGKSEWVIEAYKDKSKIKLKISTNSQIIELSIGF